MRPDLPVPVVTLGTAGTIGNWQWPTTGPVQTSLRLGVPRDTLEDDPVSNRRLVNVLLPLGVAKLAGACSGGIDFRFGRS